MKEKPILMSAPMVMAILEGRKTQTRRQCKKGHDSNMGDFFAIGECPYGEVGDHLWVKETWATAAAWDKQKPLDLQKTTPIYYHADKSHGSLVRWYDEDEERGRLRPSIFMCRWISRITLEITGVRVERLQDISEADAKAEGCLYPAKGPTSCYRMAYKELWESINGKGSWAKNPWVWIIEFKRV